ncbi:MAG: hypothetical protein U9532_03725 ['Conium maculatum' witches'-broom phytoplasma]|nr:hypothetical protein ['Conium maculatum' witches'-broom phytoplasma]
MKYHNKPFKYLFLKKNINLKHYKYKKHRICHFIEKVLIKLDNYVSQNLTWSQLLKKRTTTGKGKFRIIPKEDVEKAYPKLLLSEDDEKLNIYKLTIDINIRVCGIIDDIQGIFYVLVCDLEHKINNKS